MDTQRFICTATLLASLFVPNAVCAQDLARVPASQRPAKSSELIMTPEGSAAAYQSHGSMTQAFSRGAGEADEVSPYCRGWLIEALLRWTGRLVTKIDPLGVVDTTFDPAPGDSIQSASVSTSDWKPIPRLRPVQLHGGYGVVARITF